MAPQVSDRASSIKKNGFQNVDKRNKYEAGIAVTAEGDFPVTMMEEPKILIRESLQKEKQIVVDPLSLKESHLRQASLDITTLPPVITASEATKMHPPPLQPPKPKFLSTSLPNSANSSPRFASVVSKKKSNDESLESPCEVSNLTCQPQHQLQEIYLQKSKSCGEGRACAPSDEFDLWLIKPSAVQHDGRHHGSFSKTEAIKDSPKSGKHMEPSDKGFRCSALCLYLPGFGKAKPVRAKKEESDMDAVISRTVSLEKFECGSWASSAIIPEIEGNDSTNSYFDLPSELIKFNADDAHSPVTTAFVFDKDIKGVLKHGSTRAGGRKSDASPRHVRFSASSLASYPASPASSCITPRLQRAREEFNAFLEAQSA